jgi:hypothetical protein
MKYRHVNPVLLDRALFKFLDERLEIHARDLRADGAPEDSASGAVERYRGQLLEQLLRLVIKNGPEWFGGGERCEAVEALPSSGVSH